MKGMKIKALFKTIFAGAILLAVPLLLLSSCSKKKKLIEDIRSAVQLGISDDVPTTIDMRRITDFSWQRLYIFAPYSFSEKELGFEWAEGKESETAQGDSHCLLIFANGNKVVEYIDFPREYGDFSKAQRKGGYSMKDARFSVEKGEKWVMLLPKE